MLSSNYLDCLVIITHSSMMKKTTYLKELLLEIDTRLGSMFNLMFDLHFQ
jgi:hypothetical protein